MPPRDLATSLVIPLVTVDASFVMVSRVNLPGGTIVLVDSAFATIAVECKTPLRGLASCKTLALREIRLACVCLLLGEVCVPSICIAARAGRPPHRAGTHLVRFARAAASQSRATAALPVTFTRCSKLSETLGPRIQRGIGHKARARAFTG